MFYKKKKKGKKFKGVKDPIKKLYGISEKQLDYLCSCISLNKKRLVVLKTFND